jgi:hypothetical protein
MRPVYKGTIDHFRICNRERYRRKQGRHQGRGRETRKYRHFPEPDHGTSQYHGLVVAVRHNFAHSFQATGSYTWSHALDSLMKSTKVHLFQEGQSFVFGASFFNVLNHPNFDQPVNNVSNAGQFGRIIATVSPPTSVLGSGLGGDSSPRQIQLIAKFIF